MKTIRQIDKESVISVYKKFMEDNGGKNEFFE